MERKNIDLYIMSILFLVCIILIKLIKLDDVNAIYFSTIMSAIYFIYVVCRYGLKVDSYDWIKKSKSIQYLIVINIIYIVYSILITLILKANYIIHTINVIMPLVVWPFITTLIYKDNYLEKISKIVFYIMLISAIGALIFFVCGYSQVEFSFNNGLELSSVKYFKEVYGEVRLTWIMTHKSRYSFFLILAIGYTIFNKYISNKERIFGLIIFTINVVLSVTMTGIAVTVLLFIVAYSKNIVKLILSNKLLRYTSLIAIVVVGLFCLLYLSQKRDISTLGYRIPIWQSAIAFIIKNPLGIIGMGESFIMTNPSINFAFTNGHNVFLNEMIERGIIGGIIFIVLFICLLYTYYKNKKYGYLLVTICLMMTMMIDQCLAEEVPYIYWFVNAIWISEIVCKNNYINNRLKQYENKLTIYNG